MCFRKGREDDGGRNYARFCLFKIVVFLRQKMCGFGARARVCKCTNFLYRKLINSILRSHHWTVRKKNNPTFSLHVCSRSTVVVVLSVVSLCVLSRFEKILLHHHFFFAGFVVQCSKCKRVTFKKKSFFFKCLCRTQRLCSAKSRPLRLHSGRRRRRGAEVRRRCGRSGPPRPPPPPPPPSSRYHRSPALPPFYPRLFPWTSSSAGGGRRC